MSLEIRKFKLTDLFNRIRVPDSDQPEKEPGETLAVHYGADSASAYCGQYQIQAVKFFFSMSSA
jgi:hypothetical protein